MKQKILTTIIGTLALFGAMWLVCAVMSAVLAACGVA